MASEKIIDEALSSVLEMTIRMDEVIQVLARSISELAERDTDREQEMARLRHRLAELERRGPH